MSDKDPAVPSYVVLEPSEGQVGYRVSRDPLNWILEGGGIIAKSKYSERIGTVDWQPVGFYAKFTHLVEAYFDHRARVSTKELPEALAEAVTETYKLLDRVRKGLRVEIQA